MKKAGAFAPAIFLCFPSIPALLAYAHADSDVLCLVPLRCKNLDDKRREEQKQPFHRHPPPADEQPPEDIVVLRFQLRLVDDLYRDVCALALRANHGRFLLSVLLGEKIIYYIPGKPVIPWAIWYKLKLF